MGIFSRFTDIINANINSMLDKAEHPEKMIRLIIEEMNETLVEVRSTAAAHIAEKKTLERQSQMLATSILHWQNKAELALSKNREDLAKAALIEKHKAKDASDNLAEQLVQLEINLSQIQEDAHRLQEKLAEAKKRQAALLLRQKSVEVRLKIRESAAIHNIDEAINKFERYQQKIDQVEAQIEAYDLVANSDLNSQFKDLETNDSIEQELEELKKKVVNG